MKFLINTITHWEEPPRARHQVAYTLSNKYEVVFITANKPGFPKIKSYSIHNRLTILTPYFPIDHRIRYRLPVVNELYQYWLFRKIVREYKDYEVINFDFTATRIYNFFTNVIYYCNDNFAMISSLSNPSIIARYHKNCESIVATKAKFCVAVSSILRDNLKKFNANSFEIPLGSPDIEEYKIPVNSKPSKNKMLKIGLMGYIRTYNISHDVLNLLLNDENLKLTLIGPVEEKFLKKIEKREKIILKGQLVGKELYEEINKFDIAIAPYLHEFTTDDRIGVGTGNKIYHYFALGKPVVISYMIGLHKANLPDGFVYMANSEKEFPSLIYKAMEENSEELIKQRINFAKENTWVKRMEALIEYYNKFDVINS